MSPEVEKELAEIMANKMVEMFTKADPMSAMLTLTGIDVLQADSYFEKEYQKLLDSREEGHLFKETCEKISRMAADAAAPAILALPMPPSA